MNNDANEVPIRVYYNEDDKMKQVKQDMIKDTSEFKKFRVVDNFNERIMQEFLSWLRFVEYDENIMLIIQYQAAAQQAAQRYRRGEDSDSDDNDDPSKGFKAKDLPPLSIKNEKKVLHKIAAQCRAQMSLYPTTLDEDMKILERTDLTFNERNAVLYRSGEKKILFTLMFYAETILPLLDMDFKTARTTASKIRELDECSDYLTNSIYYLIKKENTK